KQSQEGFNMAFNDNKGTGYFSFKDSVMSIAGNTSASVVFQIEEPRFNSTYIGYAPIDVPKLAFSFVYTCQPVPPSWLTG
ncbi:hypothetical protein EY01_15045, partial [Staphylococcus aureus]